MNTKKKTIIGISAIAIVIILALVGSRLFSKKVNKPYEIMVNSKILSMYDSTKEDFEENGFESYEYLGGTFDENNSITYSPNNNNGVSGIRIYSDDIVTYKSISVGDNIEKLKKVLIIYILMNMKLDVPYILILKEKKCQH